MQGVKMIKKHKQKIIIVTLLLVWFAVFAIMYL